MPQPLDTLIFREECDDALYGFQRYRFGLLDIVMSSVGSNRLRSPSIAPDAVLLRIVIADIGFSFLVVVTVGIDFWNGMSGLLIMDQRQTFL